MVILLEHTHHVDAAVLALTGHHLPPNSPDVILVPIAYAMRSPR